MTTAASPAQDKKPFPLGELEFVALMAFGISLHALAIDAMLPAIGVIAGELGANDANERQFIVAFYLIGAALGSLLPGTLSRAGFRPVTIANRDGTHRG